MSADGDVDLTFRQTFQAGFEFFRATETAEHLNPHGKWLEAAFKGLEVLKY